MRVKPGIKQDERAKCAQRLLYPRHSWLATALNALQHAGLVVDIRLGSSSDGLGSHFRATRARLQHLRSISEEASSIPLGRVRESEGGKGATGEHTRRAVRHGYSGVAGMLLFHVSSSRGRHPLHTVRRGTVAESNPWKALFNGQAKSHLLVPNGLALA